MPRTETERLASVESKLTKVISMLEAQTKAQETWVTAAAITDITGWHFNDFKRYRENGVVKFKGKGRQIKYLVQSIPPVYLLPQFRTNITA